MLMNNEWTQYGMEDTCPRTRVYWSSRPSRRIHPHICHFYDWSHFRFLPLRLQFLDSSADPQASPGGRPRTWQAPPWPQRTCRSSPRSSPILFIISCLNCDPREKVLRPHLLAQLAARNKSVILEGRISSYLRPQFIRGKIRILNTKLW